MDMDDRASCTDFFTDDVSYDDFLGLSDIGLQTFGAQLLERLHVLHQLDNLMLINANNSSNSDLQQSLVHLSSLATMLLTQPSKLSLARVLTTGDNMKALYPYLSLLQPEDTVESAPLKVACYGYVVEMVAAAVKLDGNIHFLEHNAERICQIIDIEDEREIPQLDETVKLMELMPWLALARKHENLSYDNIAQLVDVVRDQLDHVDKLPGELFTVLRILKTLAISPHSTSSDTQPPHDNGSNDVIEELKYKYAVVQMFYSDLTSHLNSLLVKLCALFPQPGLHTTQLSGVEGSYLVHLLKPALALLYCLLRQVIQVCLISS